MATITFDNHRQATITIDNVANDISFLMSPVFDNSESNLLRDIELCENKEMKRVLESFYEHIKVKASGNISEEDDAERSESEIALEFEPGNAGDWRAVVHNIKAEHSGYWHTAQNLDAEKCSLIQLSHELEGIIIAVENIDSAITSIRSAVSTDDAVARLMELGLDMSQAKAFMRVKLDSLTAWEPSIISEKMAQCAEWIKFIENTTHQLN